MFKLVMRIQLNLNIKFKSRIISFIKAVEYELFVTAHYAYSLHSGHKKHHWTTPFCLYN